MITESKLETHRRKVRRLRELGDNPICVLCEETDLATLTRRKGILEKHHVAGQTNDAALTVILCLNCHRKATEKQRQFGVELCHEERHVMERLLNVIKGLASFFQLLSEILLAWAEKLGDVIALLDANCPNWREKTKSS